LNTIVDRYGDLDDAESGEGHAAGSGGA
jgi:hypothetical protein